VSLPPGWQADIIKGLGGQHSAGAEHLLGAWQQWEGGGTHNKATFNPLNTTRGKYAKINSVGVSAFPDWQTGIQETVGTLGGYPAISEALRTGQIDFTNPALQADFNKWLTGKATPGMSPYVAKIARSFGQDVPLSETRATTSSLGPPPAPVRVAPAPRQRVSLMDIANGKNSIMDRFFSSMERRAAPADDGHGHEAAPAAPAAPQGGGKLIDLRNPIGAATHVSDGLGWGTKTAVDIMASPGTPVGAPVDGVVTRLGSAQGGDSMYFTGDDGITRWLGHIDSRYSLKPGTRVKAGQIISRISADHPRPHLHYDSGRG
jgi:murein DD-endopeptidase MepM/ murein hydrolase activator NlpD